MIFYKTNYEDIKNLRESVYPKLEQLFNSKLLDNKSDYDPMVNNGLCSFWTVENGNKLYDWPEFKEILHFINSKLSYYLEENNITNNVVISNMWANRYGQYSFVKPHQHTTLNDTISVVVYLKKPEKSGNIHISVPTENLPEDHCISISEGDIIIFPSNYMHWTEPNLNTEEKIILGIDYQLKENNEMFSISSETKQEAVERMKEILGADLPEDKLEEAFDAAVRIVAKSFGM